MKNADSGKRVIPTYSIVDVIGIQLAFSLTTESLTLNRTSLLRTLFNLFERIYLPTTRCDKRLTESKVIIQVIARTLVLKFFATLL